MKIKMMSSGGGMPPFTYYQPVMINTEQPREFQTNDSKTSTSKKSKDDELGDKDLMKMLQDLDGLPSDREQIYQTLKAFYQAQEVGISTSSLASTYLTALHQLKTAKFNKEEYDNAYKNVNKNQAFGEVAITEEGKVVVHRNGSNELETISVDNYLKNPDKYSTVTNSELLNKRAHSLPHANNIFAVVNNSISLPVIDKLITQYLAQLGTDEIKSQGYFRTEEGKISKGIEFLQAAALKAAEAGAVGIDGASIDGLYKADLLTRSQFVQAENALQYIYKMLPENAKTLLKLKTGNESGARKLISQMICQTISNTEHFEPELQKDENSKSSSSSSSNGDTTLSAVQQMVLGYGYSEPMSINIGNSYNITTNAVHNTLVSKEGNPLKAGDSLKEITGSQQSSNLYFDHATFGGSRLNDLALDMSAIKDNNMFIVELPYKKSANGVIQPDLELTEKLEIVDDEMKKQGISPTEYQKINDLCAQQGIPPKYIQENGQWIPNKYQYMRFAMIHANIDSRALADPDEFNKGLVEEVEDDYSLEQFENLVKRRLDTNDYSVGGAWFGDPLYRGTVFIPVKNNLLQASQAVPSGSQFTIPEDDAETIREKEAIQQQIISAKQRYNKAPSLSTLQ